MGKFKIYIAIAGCAFIAALFVLFAPKSWTENVVNSMSSSTAPTDVDRDLPKKTVLDDQIQKIVAIQQKGQPKKKKEKKPVVPLPYIPGQVQEIPPTVFNEIMVKTAVSYAYKVGSCTRKTCPQIIDPSTEQWRIYAKVITESKNACFRRQLDACVIQGDILAAERRYLDAVEVAKSGLESAQGATSRCANAKDPNSTKCIDAREKSKLFSERIRDLNKVLLQAH